MAYGARVCHNMCVGDKPMADGNVRRASTAKVRTSRSRTHIPVDSLGLLRRVIPKSIKHCLQ